MHDQDADILALEALASKSGLAAADRATAMQNAAEALKTLATRNPVNDLANLLVAKALASTASLEGEAATACMNELATGLDLASITLQGAIHSETREMRRALRNLSAGRKHDLSQITELTAQTLVDEMAEDILDPDMAQADRVTLMRALLESMEAAGRSSAIGCDEAIFGVISHLGRNGVSLRDMPPHVVHRVTTAMHGTTEF